MEIDHALFLFCGRSSKDIQLRELKDMINNLKKMIKTLQATVDAAKAENLESLLPERTAKKRKARATDAERFKGVPVEKNKEKGVILLSYYEIQVDDRHILFENVVGFEESKRLPDGSFLIPFSLQIGYVRSTEISV